MVRKVLAIAALPLINALYIPHDFKGADEIARGPPVKVAYSVPATKDEDAEAEFAKLATANAPKSVVIAHGPNGAIPVAEPDADFDPFFTEYECFDEEAAEDLDALKTIQRRLSLKDNDMRDLDLVTERLILASIYHRQSSCKPNSASDAPIVGTAEVAKAPVDATMSTRIVTSAASPEDVIPDRYIVVFDDSVKSTDLSAHMNWLEGVTGFHADNYMAANIQHPLLQTGMGVDKVFNLDTFLGYSGAFLPEVAEEIANAPGVRLVERDSIVHAFNKETENSAPWGLARVSHRKPLSLGTFNKYAYDDEGGEDVTAYIVDTGVYVDHEDFEGRAHWGKTIPVGDTDRDAHGHGSHCAGTIGGKKYGVAKKAKLVAVKVLGSDGSGTMSDVIGGVEYVVQSHRAEQKKNPKLKGSTANMSLGGGKSPSLDIAINAAVSAGVHFAVAAGNENQDACNVSPAGATGPVTVGATTLSDERAYFSNYGKCVDIFAPGVNVQSVGIESPTSTALMSGTSMASPHIAGLLTYFLSLQPSSDSEYATRGAVTPKQLKEDLIAFGTPNLIEDLDAESPNVLAYNGGGKDIGDLWGAGSSRAPVPSGPSSGSFLDRVEKGFLYELAEIAEKATEFVGELSHGPEQLF